MSHKSKKKPWYKDIKDYQRLSIMNTLYSLLFTLLPFWMGLLLVLSRGRWTDWSIFYNSGEFYLYSTSFASSAFLIYHNYKINNTDWRSIFTFFSLVVVLVTSILYAFLTSNREPQVNSFIKIASIVGILCAVLLYFYSQIIANRKSPNVGNYRNDEQEEIMENLH